MTVTLAPIKGGICTVAAPGQKRETFTDPWEAHERAERIAGSHRIAVIGLPEDLRPDSHKLLGVMRSKNEDQYDRGLCGTPLETDEETSDAT